MSQPDDIFDQAAKRSVRDVVEAAIKLALTTTPREVLDIMLIACALQAGLKYCVANANRREVSQSMNWYSNCHDFVNTTAVGHPDLEVALKDAIRGVDHYVEIVDSLKDKYGINLMDYFMFSRNSHLDQRPTYAVLETDARRRLGIINL